jgi:hypothetical protein
MLGVFCTFRGVMVVLAQANCPGKRDLPSMLKRQNVRSCIAFQSLSLLFYYYLGYITQLK